MNTTNNQIYNQNVIPPITYTTNRCPPISFSALFIANILLFSFFGYGHDVLHYYRADPLFSEPRFEKPWLASLDIDVGSGQTATAFDCHGKKVNILDIYRSEKKLKKKIQKGSFDFHELTLAYTQNFNYGLFVKAHLPLRTDRFFIHTITDNITDHPFTDHLPCIIATECIKNTGTGDLSIMGGWTINYQQTKTLDFVDITLKAGVLVPTSHKRRTYPAISVPSIPYGYDKLWGIPLSADVAIGCYEWLTIGSHVEVLPLCARQNRITYSRLGLYSKADHLIHGLSLSLGYTYSNKNSSLALPKKNRSNINSNIQQDIGQWSMHTIHFAIEYDFTEYDNFFGPRIGFSINTPVYGKNIFKTTMSGLFFGLELAI